MLRVEGIIATVAAACVIASFIWRDASHMNNPNEAKSQIVTIAVTVCFGALMLFIWGMKLTPRLCYRRYIKESYGGLSRTYQGVVASVSQELTFREGLYFYACVINVRDMKNPEDDRLLYWDAQLGAPPFAASDAVCFAVHGNDIIGFDPAG